MRRILFSLAPAALGFMMLQNPDPTPATGGAAKSELARPPVTPPIPSFKLPPVYETRLANGLNVVLVEDARFPLITARLSFLAGSKFDPPALPGLSENVAALLTEGTKTRTSRQLAEELASIGGTITGGAGPDGLTLAASSLSEHAPKLLDLLADVSRNAVFPAPEIDLRKTNRKQSLLAQRSQSSFLAEERLHSAVFGPHPYAHIAPTMESLDRFTAGDLARFRDAYLIPNNGNLILLGKLPPRAETLKLIERQFGTWQSKPAPAGPEAKLPPARRRIVLVDRPGSVQADIHLGQLALTRSDPDYFPLIVGGIILGQGPGSRMFANIREKQGFAYDAHSEIDTYKDAGIFAAVTQVRNDVIGQALQAVIDELEGMAKTPVAAEELADAKNYASGLFLLRLETQSGLADQLNTMKLLGLPNDYLEKYTERIRAVQPPAIQAAAKKYVAPAEAAIVVVGDAQKIGPALEKFGKPEIVKAN
jgi:zinc protease